ncbi:hypothetical protein C8F01DRAFT_1252030 [Mycena amicta]|nr:hypothetical protein C8F01DRAFT_1252030 [Mycena amicta]
MTNWNYFDAPPDSYDAMLAAQQQQEEYEKQGLGQASTSKTKTYDRPSRKSKGKEKAREEPSNRPEYLDSDSEPEYSKPWRRSPPSSPEPNPLRMPPPHSFHAPLRTSLDMPVPGSKEAPKTFRGKYHEVERFIRHIEHLFTKNRITNDKERCTLILDYCSTNVQNVIRTMEYFRTPRWTGLRREILRMFDAERTQHKYRPVDVVSFAREMNKRSLNSMTQWRRYSVKYNTIAGGPYTQGRLSEENYLGYFWFGIPKDLRTALEARILQGRSLQDLKQYSMNEISTAAEWHFRRTRAEALLLDATDFGFEERDADEDSDSDSEESDSDSDYGCRRPRRHKRSSSSTRKVRETKGKARDTKTPTTKSKVKFAGNEEEIAGMIKQLNGMKIDDPDYAPTYYKVLALDQTGNASKDSSAVEMFYQTRTELDETEEEASDWDAGETDAELGSDGDKTIYLTVPKTVQFEEDAQVFEADRTIPSTREARRSTFKGVYPPARPTPTATPGRSPIRQKVRTGPPKSPLPPTPSVTVKDAVPHDKPEESANPLMSPQKPLSLRPPTPPRSSLKKPSIPEVIPVDARAPRFHPEEEDEEMRAPPPIRVRDIPIPRDPVDAVRDKTEAERLGQRAGIKTHVVPNRQSAISSTVNRADVTNRVLDTKVEVSLRELMEVSKEVRTDFSELIRVRNSKVVLMSAKKLPNAMVGNFAWPRTDGVLIRVEMVTGDSTLWAIIDTGSQLNVIRGELARQKIKRVVDMTCVISMNDANGGSGQLRGMIRGAELTCGGLRTEADLWVSEQAPFDLLLGRPWQRANKVSIDERREGTYLVFKDASTGRPRFEMLAASAEVALDDPSVHYQAMTCLHVDERQELLTDREVFSEIDDKAGNSEEALCDELRQRNQTIKFTIVPTRKLFQSVLRVVAEVLVYGLQVALVAVAWISNSALSVRRANSLKTRQGCLRIKPERGHVPSLINPKAGATTLGSDLHGLSEFHYRTTVADMSMGKQLDEKRQREPPPTSEGCIDAPTGTLPLEGGAEYTLDEGGLAMEEPESQHVLRSLQEAARHGQRASYKSFDPELANKLDQNYHLLLFASPPPWIIRHPFLSFTPSMAIRSPPTPPSIAHRSSLSSLTMFILPETSSPRHHLRINNEETSMSDGGDQEAAQILVSLRSATNVSTNLHSTPTPDPLTFLLDLPPSLTYQTALPLNPLSLAMLAYPDQEIPSTSPHLDRTESIGERATPPTTRLRAPYPSPSLRPLLPRRDTPFPYFDPQQRVQTQRLQLEVLESRNEGVVAEHPVLSQAPIQAVEGEDEGKHLGIENQQQRVITAVGEYRMDVDEAQDSSQAPASEEENSSAQPTQPPVVATLANTESVNAAIAELGVPVDRPPTVFRAPLTFQQQTRFNAATYTILRHYLPDDPHLQAMAEKIIDFQAHAPEAERLALLQDVLAAFIWQIIRRVEEAQAQAQAMVGEDVVHGWVLLLEALHWSHERLADETSAALEKVLEIASEYAFLLGKVTEAIDEVHEREVTAYQNRLTASGRTTGNATASSPERQSAPSNPTLPATTNEPPAVNRYSPVGDRAAIRGWDFLTEEAPLRSPEEERELARELANMQFGPEELSREEVMPPILAPIPLHPASSVTRLEASVNPGDTVGTNSSASFAFPFNSLAPGEVGNEGTKHEDSRKIVTKAFVESPTQTVVSELLDEYGQLHSVGEQDPAQIVFQRAFAYVLRHPFSPDDGDRDVFRDDAQILARTTSSDTERSSIWGEPSPEAIESLAAVRRMEDEYRRVADEFLAPPPEQPAPDNVLGLVFEEAPAPPVPAEPPSTAIVYTAWPQGSIASPSDIGRITNTVKFEFGTATSTHHAALDCPPTPVVHRQPAVSFTAIARGPELWDRPPVAYADNNPCYPHFRPRPNQPYDPLLSFDAYAKKGAFLRTPIDRGINNEAAANTVLGRPSFLLFLSDLRLNHHPYALPDALGPRMEQELAAFRRQPAVREAVVFSVLRSAVNQAHNPYALGQLLDHDSIEAPNGYRLAYSTTTMKGPSTSTQRRRTPNSSKFSGPHFDLALHARAARTHALAFIQRAFPYLVSQGADLEHAVYQWYQDHQWATRRRFFGTHPFLRPFERALGEIIWSQLSEFGEHAQANDWARFLNVRYVCDDVLEDLLEMGWLDIDAEVGDEGLWTQQLPNLVYDDHSSFTAASVPPDEERKQLFREADAQFDEAEMGSSSDDLSYFSQDDSDDDGIESETVLVEEMPNPHTWTTFRAPLCEPINFTHFNEIPPGTRFVIDTGAPVTVSTSAATMAAISEPLHVYIANPPESVHPPPSTNEPRVPLNTPTGDTERDHVAESLDEYEDVTDGEGPIEMDVREEDDGWYDYASDGGSWA